MEIFVFGNPIVETDSLPITLLPALREQFSGVTFTTLDPNENWNVPRHMYIIDTVVGIEEPRVFETLEGFMASPRVSCHDFDAYANIMLMKKLGKIDGVTIVGVPPNLEPEQVLPSLTKKLDVLLEKV